MISFDDILRNRDWKPMPHCPGRYILAGGLSSITFAELLGKDLPVREYRTEKAADPVLVCDLSEGGIISYRKENQYYIHTLCTAEGFQRKLEQLGIG